jgi:hypothetical protein
LRLRFEPCGGAGRCCSCAAVTAQRDRPADSPRTRGQPFSWASKLVFIAPSWLGIAGIVLAVRLAAAWLRSRVEAGLALLIPLAMLALIALWLIEERSYHVNWGGRIVIALCLLLALLGRLEQRGRLETFRVPELLRFDRL